MNDGKAAREKNSISSHAALLSICVALVKTKEKHRRLPRDSKLLSNGALNCFFTLTTTAATAADITKRSKWKFFFFF